MKNIGEKMNEREKIIRLWFDMWLTQKDLGIDDIFLEDVIYIESWCLKYENRQAVKHWFNEWNTRGKVEEFDGVSLIVWTADDKIKFLKEFGCNCNNYNPYQESETPLFRDEKTNWF